MKEMLLFGAGASKEAGVPLAYELSKCISDEFRNQRHLTKYAHAVSFVLGGLLFNRGIQGGDPLVPGVNIEEFFNAVMMLADRSTLDAAPFVGSWHSMIDQLDRIKPPFRDVNKIQQIIYQNIAEKLAHSLPNSPPGFSASNLDRKIKEFVLSVTESKRSGTPTLGRDIADFVMTILKQQIAGLKNSRSSDYRFAEEFKSAVDRQTRPGEGKIFHDVAREMVKMLARFVLVENAERVAYMAPLCELLKKQSRLTVATLNYDNCVELFCENNGVDCRTGIDEWSKNGTFEFDGAGVFLLKLHGSIDWKSGESQPSPERPMPHRVISRVPIEEAKKSDHQPAIIFGQRNKLTAEGPFLELLRSFQRELAEIDRLNVVGYSFADPHINVFISQWLNASTTRQLRIVDPFFDPKRNEYTSELGRFAGERKIIVAAKAGDGLRTLFGEQPAAEAELQ